MEMNPFKTGVECSDVCGGGQVLGGAIEIRALKGSSGGPNI